MDAVTRLEWDRLWAEWDSARRQLDEHWRALPEKGPDLQWRADHRTYETLAELAATACLDFAAAALSARHSETNSDIPGIYSPDR